MDALKEEWPLAGAGRADWEQAAAAVLRKSHRMTDGQDPAEAADVLSTRSLEGVVVPALGTADDLVGLAPTGLPGQPPYVRGSAVRTQGWDVRIPLADPDPVRAARSALTDLERGGTSLWVTIGTSGTDPADLPAVLADVFLDFAPVVLQPDSGPACLTAARQFLQILQDRELVPAPGSSFGADPIGLHARGLLTAEEVGPLTAEVAALATRPGLRALVVDGTTVHNAGAGQAQELAYSLAAGVGYLRLLQAAGIAPDRACELLEFRYAATDDQFLTIAMLRAARRLWHRVTELSEVGPAGRAQHQHAVTSWAMTTRYDPWVNMLRATVAAFAAGTAGADSVTVLPFDDALGISDDMARRVARNTSSLLISESHVAAVSDPAGGSYAVERLTDSLAKAAWAEFGRIEAEGGVFGTLAGGGLAGRVAAVAAERERLIDHRRLALTGINEFPLADEKLLDRPARQQAPSVGPFAPRRYSAAFEELRDNPTAETVFIAALGSVAGHTARATFTVNLLASGGVGVDRPAAPATVPDLVTAFRASGSSVAAVVGSDAAYEAEGATLISGLRAAGASWILLAGRPPAALADLVDDHVVAGSDAISFLTSTRTHLTGAV